MKYIVVSYKPENMGCTSAQTNYFVPFDNKEDAVKFLNLEQHDFRSRELYDCTNGLSQSFVNDWCWDGDEDDAEENGYIWYNDFEKYVRLSEI